MQCFNIKNRAVKILGFQCWASMWEWDLTWEGNIHMTLPWHFNLQIICLPGWGVSTQGWESVIAASPQLLHIVAIPLHMWYPRTAQCARWCYGWPEEHLSQEAASDQEGAHGGLPQLLLLLAAEIYTGRGRSYTISNTSLHCMCIRGITE